VIFSKKLNVACASLPTPFYTSPNSTQLNNTPNTTLLNEYTKPNPVINSTNAILFPLIARIKTKIYRRLSTAPKPISWRFRERNILPVVFKVVVLNIVNII